MSRRILVTGGAGFIGSAIARSYAHSGSDVVILDAWLPGSGAHRCNLSEGIARVHNGDIRDERLLDELMPGCDLVVHAASHTSHVGSMQDPRMDMSHNIDGMAAVLECMRRHCPQAGLVYLSTRQVYGRPQFFPVDEAHPLQPPDVNAIAKIAAENLCRLYCEVYGIRAISLRLTNIYGPGMRVCDARQMFLGSWIRSAIEGGEITIFGDGSQRRDLLYVDDVVSAVRCAETSSCAGQAINIASGQGITLCDLANMIRQSEDACNIVYRPFPAERKAIDIGDFIGAITMAKNELRWEPQISLASGLSRTIAYYRKHLHDYMSEHA